MLDTELFNFDQIYFIEKNEFQATQVIRCSDIEGLKPNIPLDKWYLTGRLGGTAIINDAYFRMIMQEEN